MNNVIKMLLVLSFTVVLSGCSLTSRLFESNINPDTGDEYKNTHLPIYSCAGDHETVKIANYPKKISDSWPFVVRTEKVRLFLYFGLTLKQISAHNFLVLTILWYRSLGIMVLY